MFVKWLNFTLFQGTATTTTANNTTTAAIVAIAANIPVSS